MKSNLNKLDFRPLADDGIIEARVTNGFYHIFESNTFDPSLGFRVSGSFGEVGDNYDSIEEAIDAANEHHGVESTREKIEKLKKIISILRKQLETRRKQTEREYRWQQDYLPYEDDIYNR